MNISNLLCTILSNDAVELFLKSYKSEFHSKNLKFAKRPLEI